MGKSKLSHKAAMSLIATSGGNTAVFFRNMRRRRGYFRRLPKMTKKYQLEKGGPHARK